MTVPPDALADLAKVRRAGEVNMLDYYSVQRLAFEMDCHALVVWMEEVGVEEYGRIVMTGDV